VFSAAGRERISKRLLNPEYLDRAHAFFEQYGGKAVVLSRFVPIVRTFAPFVAGIGQMRYARFLAFNVVGAVGWVASIVTAGYLLANLPVVQKQFHLVIFAIIFISILPALIEIAREYLRAKKSPAA
jgi:membrane-associated protein